MVDFLSSTALRLLGTRSNETSLAAIDTTILKNGSAVFVTSIADIYFLLKESTATADGLNIIQPINGRGRWFRSFVGSAIWSSQAAWAVNANTGDDSGPGTPTEPLRTGTELSRRIGLPTTVLNQVTSVEIQSALPATDLVNLRPTLGPQGQLVVRGTAATTLATVVLTGVTNLNPGVARGQIQVAGFDWTPYLNRRCRVLSSATAATETLFWVEAIDANPEIAYISKPFVSGIPSFAPYGQQNLGIGDSIVVESLTTLSCPIYIDPTTAVVSDGGLWFVTDMVLPSAFWGGLSATSGFLYGCQVNKFHSGYFSYMTACQCRHYVVVGTLNAQATSFSGGENIFVNGNLRLVDNCSVAGVRMHITENSYLTAQSTGFFDWSASALTVADGSRARLLGLIWGSSATAGSIGLNANSNCVITYNAASKPTVAGAAADTRVGGVNTAYAAIPLFSAVNGAGIVVTAT